MAQLGRSGRSRRVAGIGGIAVGGLVTMPLTPLQSSFLVSKNIAVNKLFDAQYFYKLSIISIRTKRLQIK